MIIDKPVFIQQFNDFAKGEVHMSFADNITYKLYFKDLSDYDGFRLIDMYVEEKQPVKFNIEDLCDYCTDAGVMIVAYMTDTIVKPPMEGINLLQ